MVWKEKNNIIRATNDQTNLSYDIVDSGNGFYVVTTWNPYGPFDSRIEAKSFVEGYDACYMERIFGTDSSA